MMMPLPPPPPPPPPRKPNDKEKGERVEKDEEEDKDKDKVEKENRQEKQEDQEERGKGAAVKRVNLHGSPPPSCDRRGGAPRGRRGARPHPYTRGGRTHPQPDPPIRRNSFVVRFCFACGAEAHPRAPACQRCRVRFQGRRCGACFAPVAADMQIEGHFCIYCGGILDVVGVYSPN
ncbi:uncharacterized protein LOC118438945 [Folsomia candida]|uniref:uncharacterized protein LOC118438945 n=1 Tax=Folsomia candida TaxID=158441 RepID=UPI001604B1CD|nr:uncharacterized protein LOC118438945 [Folsomia candida]